MRYHPLLVAIALVACGGSPTPPPAGPAAQVPTDQVPESPAATDPYTKTFNLDFEDVADGQPKDWLLGIGFGAGSGVQGYERSIDRDAHGGESSLRLRATGGGEFGSMARVIDATTLRGKRVRLHGWVKTDGVAGPGWAGVWVRADGGSVRAFDNMVGRGLDGTDGWREAEARIDVPDDALTIVIGPLLVGEGTAWFDDFRLEVGGIAVAKPITLAGIVTDPSGKPAAGATVTLMTGGGDVVSFVATDGEGRFRLQARAGAWGISAHHPSGTGTFFDPREFSDDTNDLRLTLGTGGVLARGRLVIEGLVPEGTHVEIAPFSNHYTDGFAIRVGADGRFEARLPRGESYWAKVKGPSLIGQSIVTPKGDELTFEMAISVLEPPPADVNAWVAQAAVPLVSAEAGHGFDDLRPIGAMIGKARIVALGEATHGTREFFQLKHRFLEYLVAEHGFTVFAIEANLTECRVINDYVLHGKGDAETALDGIYFWVWNTKEVLAMIEWMRAWNADPAHETKVQFVGFDMQFTKVAHANVVTYLRKVAPAEADALLAPLEAFATTEVSDVFKTIPAAEQQAAMDAVATLGKRFDRSRTAWSKKVGRDAFLDAREDLRVIGQAMTEYRADAKSFDARDLAMADNVDQLLARQPKGTRVVLWAHNGHVSNGMGSVVNQGQHLRDRHGADYVAFGFVFGEGSFQAKDFSSGQDDGLKAHTLGAPPAWDVSAPFRANGKPIVVLDLRQAPPGRVAAWFAAPHPMRDTGSVFTTEANMSGPQELSRRYDAIIYVDKTTRARPNPGGERPAPKKK